MNFIVCSYGGSGSWMLVNYLNNFGKAYHVHDRYPPNKLTYPDPNTERFSKIEVEPDKLESFKVIFIYKNPVQAIFSRFNSVDHLRNIQSSELTYRSIFGRNVDCFGITEYYNTYMNPSDRNYSIFCIKYETFFANIDNFNQTMGISIVDKNLLPVKKETARHYKPEEYKYLMTIYAELIEDMANRPAIFTNQNQSVLLLTTPHP